MKRCQCVYNPEDKHGLFFSHIFTKMRFCLIFFHLLRRTWIWPGGFHGKCLPLGSFKMMRRPSWLENLGIQGFSHGVPGVPGVPVSYFVPSKPRGVEAMMVKDGWQLDDQCKMSFCTVFYSVFSFSLNWLICSCCQQLDKSEMLQS